MHVRNKDNIKIITLVDSLLRYIQYSEYNERNLNKIYYFSDQSKNKGDQLVPDRELLNVT